MRLRAPALSVLMLVVLVLAMSAISGCASTESPVPSATEGSGSSVDPAPEPAPSPAPVTPDDPKALVELKCSMCHSLDRVWSVDYERAQWVDTVDRMKRNGLVITDEEYTTIVDYLAEQ